MRKSSLLPAVLALMLACCCGHGFFLDAQVIVSMELLDTQGTRLLYGSGLGAYPWNVHACGAGAAPVPWDIIRMNFPEVRVYSRDQAETILSQRSTRSAPARTLEITAYLAAAAGLGIQVNSTLKKSSSQVGTVAAISGLAVPVITSLLLKKLPAYVIKNSPPDVLALQVNQCADYTVLAAKGTAPATILPRRIDPIFVQPGVPAKE